MLNNAHCTLGPKQACSLALPSPATTDTHTPRSATFERSNRTMLNWKERGCGEGETGRVISDGVTRISLLLTEGLQ